MTVVILKYDSSHIYSFLSNTVISNEVIYKGGVMKVNHGYISIIWFLGALVLNLISIIKSNVLLGICYAVYIFAYFFIVAYLFCRTCPHTIDDTCKHYFIGRLTKVMPKASSCKTKPFSMFLVLVFSVILIGFPQFFLIRDIYLLMGSWVLIIIAVIEIVTKVCKECKNYNCPNCKYRSTDETGN